MRSIRKLSDEARSGIRSAYIITSVQQLTRELLDNAIEADSTQIQVLISLDDWSIKLTDNGIGIQKDSLAELGRSHMSSKKGSKGETLASISKLASLKITTRHASSLSTHTLITRAGHSVYFGLSLDGNRSSRGTVVTVTDIFANIPVRRKSLNKAREIHGIKSDMQSLALVHPEIAFELRNSQQILIQLPPKSHDTVSRFREIFGYALAEHVEEINYHGSDHVVDGFMSLECAHSRAYQYIFVNSHLIVAGDLHSVVSTTFAESPFGVMANEPASMESIDASRRHAQRYPVFLIHIHIPSSILESTYDRHHRMFYIDNQASLSNTLKQLVIDFLVKYSFISPVAESYTSASNPRHSQATTLSKSVTANKRAVSDSAVSTQQSVRSVTSPQPSRDTKKAKNENTSRTSQQRRTIDVHGINSTRTSKSDWLTNVLNKWNNPTYRLLKSTTATSVDSSESRRESFKLTKTDIENARVVGQVDDKFIMAVVTTKNALVAFDQHAVDERIRVERYLEALIRRDDIVLVDPPIGTLLTYEEMRTLGTNVETVEQWGFLIDIDIKPSQEHYGQVFVKTLPGVMHDRLIREPKLVQDIIQEAVARGMNESTTLNWHVMVGLCPPTLLSLVNSKACRNSIKFGDTLSMRDCEMLLQSLSHTKNPYQCAHGRPTVNPLIRL
ncbi:hypothetical protein E3Q13_01141 [Wallemia mellicola]|nr:hypothetical protein E3Q13_01141 [Wallemia mellicola]